LGMEWNEIQSIRMHRRESNPVKSLFGWVGVRKQKTTLISIDSHPTHQTPLSFPLEKKHTTIK